MGKTPTTERPPAAAQVSNLPWRLELFYETREELERQIPFLRRHHITGLNVTNKSHEDDLLQTAEILLQALPGIDLCLHYSLKFNYAKTPSSTFGGLQTFCSRLQQQVQRFTLGHPAAAHHVLLVSGGGKKKRYDSVAALQQMATTYGGQPQQPYALESTPKRARVALTTSPATSAGAANTGTWAMSRSAAADTHPSSDTSTAEWPQFGVAFNPYLPNEQDAATERQRLRAKLETGLVSKVYLQMGTDFDKLNSGVVYVKALFEELYTQEGKQQPQLLGSIFLPSKRLLAQMKFRPWNGVFLSAEYLSSVEAADAITRDILQKYATSGVVPLVESAVKTDHELSYLLGLLSVSEAEATQQQ